MRTTLLRAGVILTLTFLVFAVALRPSQRRLVRLTREFEEYSGARLVFERDELPPGTYHDVLVTLPDAGRVKAAEICLHEVKKYPPGYLGWTSLFCHNGARRLE